MNCSSSFNDLPDELIEKISYEMDGETLKQFCLVSKRFCSLVKLPNICKTVFVKKYDEFYRRIANMKIVKQKSPDWKKLDLVEFPMDEKDAFACRIHRNGWKDSYRCYKKSVEDLIDESNATPCFRMIITPPNNVPFFLILFILIYFSFKIAVQSSFFCCTILSTTVLFSFLYVIICLKENLTFKISCKLEIELVVVIFCCCIYVPLLFIEEFKDNTCLFIGMLSVAAITLSAAVYWNEKRLKPQQWCLFLGAELVLVALKLASTILFQLATGLHWLGQAVLLLLSVMLLSYVCQGAALTLFNSTKRHMPLFLSLTAYSVALLANGAYRCFFRLAWTLRLLPTVGLMMGLVAWVVLVLPCVVFRSVRAHEKTQREHAAVVLLRRRLGGSSAVVKEDIPWWVVESEMAVLQHEYSMESRKEESN